MGLSKSKRILILLIIDTAFFLLELIVGRLENFTGKERLYLIRDYRLCRPFACSRCGFISYGTLLSIRDVSGLRLT